MTLLCPDNMTRTLAVIPTDAASLRERVAIARYICVAQYQVEMENTNIHPVAIAAAKVCTILSIAVGLRRISRNEVITALVGNNTTPTGCCIHAFKISIPDA